MVRVLDEDGDVVLDEGVRRDEVLSPQVAYQMVSMMREVVDRGTAAQVRAWGVRFPVGAKTGTTNDFKDAWFVGTRAPSWRACGWATTSPRPLGATRSEAAWRFRSGPISCAARHACFVPAKFTLPAGLRDEELCRISHLRPVEDCPTYVESTSRPETTFPGGCARSTTAR